MTASPTRWPSAQCRWLIAGALVLLAGCRTPPAPPDPPADQQAPEAEAPAASSQPPVATVRLITAQTPVVRSYRKAGAGHIYKQYGGRIYKGKIPPLVYAVVVVETHLDAKGNVEDVSFSRVPEHAPEVAPAIARLVRDASPFPPPTRVGPHTYVDTWLWDRSGNFQLDTLTLGQRSR